MSASTDAPLVDTAWLAARLGDDRLRVFDCTVHLRPAVPGPYVVESGRADYERAHIPGAAFLDLGNDLSDPNAELRFTLPTAARLAAAFGAAGIHADDTVVLYSSTTPMWATRVWWMFACSSICQSTEKASRSTCGCSELTSSLRRSGSMLTRWSTR